MMAPLISIESQRGEFLGTRSAANSAEHGDIGQLLVSCHAAQQEAAATHISAPDELAGETQPLPKVRKEALHIFSSGDAAEEDDFIAVESSERGCRCCERFDVARFGDIDGHGGKLPEATWIHGRIPRQQSARWGNHLRAGDSARRSGKVPRVGQLSAEVQAAAKGEYFAERGVADLDAAREFECRLRSQQHPRSEAPGMRGGEKEYPFHDLREMPAQGMGYAKPRRFMIA